MFKVRSFFFLILLVSMNLQAEADKDLVPRIEKIGKVCVLGMDCNKKLKPINEAVEATKRVASIETISPVEKNYNIGCGTCHNAGVAGAPILGNEAQWTSRIAKGMEVLYANSINGFSVMPAKGMCLTCTDDEIREIVDYMVDSSRP